MKWDIIFWVVLAALAFVGEILSVSFFLLFFALGAAVGLVLAFLNFGVGIQIAGFIVASVLSMVILRPALLNRLSLQSSEQYKSRGSVTGKSGVVTGAIEPGSSGTVRIGSGDFWTARAVYPDQKIAEGTRVRVLDTDGFTALVEAVEVEGGE